MPYELSKENGKFCVKKQGGETLHCYDDEEKAKSYMRALYANVKDASMATFSMRIEKASFDKATQTYRWRMVASDTDKDLYDEKMSKELYQDFVERIKSKTDVPEPFKSVLCQDGGWCGGMPYLSVSHYHDGGGKFVPGMPEEIFVDGNYLKAKGTLMDTPLGMAVWKSLNQDLYGKSDYENKIRVSIGFLDLEHEHVAEQGGQNFTFSRKSLDQKCPLCEQGIGGKIYKKGQLVHLALTRVPVNPRTEMEVEKAMADGTILTKKDDAKSIVGDLADALDDELEQKSVLVVKADGTTQPDPFNRDVGEHPTPATDKIDECYDPDTNSYDQECVDKKEGKASLSEYQMELVRSGAATFAKLQALSKVKGVDLAKLFTEESMADELKVKAKVDKETAKEDAEETAQEEQAENDKQAGLKGKGKKDMPMKSAALETAFEAIAQKVLEVKSVGLTQENVQEIQEAYASLGEVIKSEAVPETPVDMGNLVEVIRSTVNQAMDAKMGELERKLAVQLAAKSAPVNKNSIQNIARRSVSLPVTQQNVLLQNRSTATAKVDGKKLTQIQKLAMRSTGIQVED